MKKNILYLLLGILALTSSCQDPEYVLPTADRQGITSLTALFTSGPYVDKEAVVYTIADASVDKYVIPMPWYYPENSDNETSEYMKAMRIISLIQTLKDIRNKSASQAKELSLLSVSY